MSDVSSALLSWASIFPIESAHHTFGDFIDGIAFAEMLHHIEPSFFEAHWLDGFVQDCGNTWRLKMSNLQRVLQRLQDFYLEATGSTVTAPNLLPDIKVLSEFQMESSDEKTTLLAAEAVSRFLHLIVGCAVNCPKRQFFIEAILKLETDIQTGVMEAVKVVLEETKLGAAQENSDNSISDNAANQIKNEEVMALRNQLQSLTNDKDELIDRIRHLEHENLNLRSRAESVARQEQEVLHRDSTGTASLREEIERLRDEMEKLDTMKDEWRHKADSAEMEAAALRARVSELVTANRETKRLRDELDVARIAVERLPVAESQIEQLQKKLESSSAAQRKLKTVEERLQSAVNDNTALQDQINRLKAASKRKAVDGDSPSSETPDDDIVAATLRFDLLQKQYDEVTAKLADTREQLLSSLSQNRTLADENSKLRQAAAESTQTNFETLPSIQSLQDEVGVNEENIILDDSDKDEVCY